MLKKSVASIAVALAVAFGTTGAYATERPSSAIAPLVSAGCGYGTPHSTPGGVKCLGPGEYCSHKPGYAAAYHRAGFRCNASGRLEYD